MVSLSGAEIVLKNDVPFGHKLALKPIAAGASVLRYGQVIGHASRDIAAGEHIHTHNLQFEEIVFDYEFPVGDRPAVPVRGTPRAAAESPMRMRRPGACRRSAAHRRAISQR